MHVLIGTDGSTVSVDAARRGIELLGKPERVTLLTVLGDVPGVDDGGFGGSVFTPEEQEVQWRAEIDHAHAELARTAQSVHSTTVDSRIELVRDGVAGTICEIATDIGADVIVVGSHARSGLGRLLIGSVSEHVVRHAPCPVLVVREGKSAGAPVSGK